MAEPTYAANSATFAMEDDTDYTLSDAELNDICYEGYRGFILVQNGTPLNDELDDGDFTNWYDYTSLTDSPAVYTFTHDSLLQNPNFELDTVTHGDWEEFEADAITGWESDVSWGICHTYWGITADDGDYFLSGGIDTYGDGDIWQDVDLVAEGFFADEIDDDNAEIVSFSCRRRSESTDKGQVLVQFLDSGKSVISAAYDSGMEAPPVIDGWVTRSCSNVAIPATTRYIRVTLSKEWLFGTTCGCLFDDLQMKVTCLQIPIFAFNNHACKVESSASDWSTYALWGGLGSSSSHEVWFYDDGSAITATERSVNMIKGGAAPAYVTPVAIGLLSTESASNYVYWDNELGGGSGWVDTGHTRSAGWHTMRYRYYYWAVGIFPNTIYHWRVQLYLDGSLLINEEVDSTDTGDAPGYARCKSFGVKTGETGKPLYIDRIRGSKTGKLYVDTGGTVETPKAQPDAVGYWDSIDETDDTSVQWKGSTLYEFQWSTNGGSSWNGTWIEATGTNLHAVPCGGDGDDAIKFRVTLTAHANTLHTPRVRGLTINYGDPTGGCSAVKVHDGVVGAVSPECVLAG